MLLLDPRVAEPPAVVMDRAGTTKPSVGAARPAPKHRYHPALDGVRAFAVIAAMLFHAGVLHGGFLGVDLFFVLSGFLITSLLLDEAMRNGTFLLRQFWLRRVRRLAPALMLMLVVVAYWTYHAASPSLALTTAKQTGWSVVYANNWYAIFGHVGYWGAAATSTPLSHLWSLAIEEQFYLVWPVLLLVVIRVTRSPRAVVALCLCGVLASSAWQWWLADHAGPSRAYLDSGSRAEALLLGCLLAALMTVRRPAPSGTHRARNGAPILSSLVFVLAVGWLAISWARANLDHGTLYHGWLVSCGVAGTALIATVVTHRSAWYAKVLSIAPLVWIGKRSYSLYLWHWPIWVMITSQSIGQPQTTVWVVRIAVTVVVSAGCYRLWETPLRRSNVTWGLISAVGAPAAIVAAVVTFAPPAAPAEFGKGQVTLAGSGGSGSLTVLVAGDSWARNMGYGLSLADTSHRHTFIDLGTSGCGIAPGQSADCVRGEQEWQRAVIEQQPNVALLLTGTVDQDNGAVVKGVRTFPCSTTFDAAYAQALDRTIAALHGPRNIPVYVATVRDNVNGKKSESTCMNHLLTAAAARDGARVLDLGAQLCPRGGCVGSVAGQPVYDDTMHLAPAGQKWIGGWILSTLQSQVTGGTVTQAITGPCVPTNATLRAPIDVAAYHASPSKLYPDSAKHTKLTDGVLANPTVWDSGWLGWQQQSADITVRLPHATAVCAVASTWLQELDAAVYPPSSISVFVSDNSRSLGRLLGVARAPQLSSGNQATTETALAGSPITGRYITLRVTALNGWSFVDEVSPQGLPGNKAGGHG